MTSRKIEDLSTAMLACAVEFELQLRGRRILFVRACTYRSPEEQAGLYSIGRTIEGRIVTNCGANKSHHNNRIEGRPASNAADYFPLYFGKLCGDKTKAELALWENMGQIAEACGLEWGGRWPAKKRDRPHFQLKGLVKL